MGKLTLATIADRANLTQTDDTVEVAAKVGRALVEVLGFDGSFMLVIGDERGGRLDGHAFTDRWTFAEGYGSGYSSGGAELLAEDASEVLLGLSLEVADRLESVRSNVGVELATSWALSFYEVSS